MQLKNSFLFILPGWLLLSSVMAATTNLTAILPARGISTLGINCRGNLWCPWFPRPSNRILTYLLDWVKAEVHDEDVYYHGAHIACASLYAIGNVQGAAFCVFTQGPNSRQINGSVIKSKLTELKDHGCFACGSVPIAEDNDPNALGILTLNHVVQEKCKRISDRKTPVCKPSEPAPAVGTNLQLSIGVSPPYQTFNISRVDSVDAPIATAE